ncbi:MAG: Co2+/Mg2+ efflux protein ApaG [Bacteroidetes bacterium]|nr:Co2+/Mg2+ efflux protein ApaG [Bacteroidota bacterium]
MVTEITKGIRISVNTRYQEEFSSPDNLHFIFSYHIIIENQNEFAVQLLRRHWYIFDSSGEQSEVEGEGVVGEQPVLQPGQIYEYESACNLNTDLGKMHGTYTMVRQSDGAYFEVLIPEFQLIVPYKLN